MTFTYVSTDLSTSLAKVRRLISDVDSTQPIFADEEIEAFLVMENSRVRRGAAMALETMAASDVYVLKVMRRGDLETDGAKTSAELRALAKRFRDEDAAAESESEDGAFDIAEMVLDDFSYRERVAAEALRGAL